MVHVAQIKTVHYPGHAGGIRIPVQQIKGEGILAHQIVVDHEGPDQIIAAQQVECRGHGCAVQDAPLFLHLLLQLAKLFVIDEYRQFARHGEIHQRRKKCRRFDAIVIVGRHMGQGGPGQGAAQAIADNVHLVLATGRLDAVHGGINALGHVVVEGFIGQTLIGVDPGNHEHG